MKTPNPENVNYKDLMQARRDGLVVQSEQECREEQFQVIENEIERRQRLFDGFYGSVVSQKQRNEYYAVIDRECRKGKAERGEFYPKMVREKMQYVRLLLSELRQLGVSENALEDLLRPERPISRIYITHDYRIFLPEFHDVEVQLRPLAKSVFILFLRHPEGIVLKEMGNHFLELMQIYSAILGPKFREAEAKISIRRICNPLDNSINEKISRIHEALRKILDETIAMQYFIQGKRSGVRQILLPQVLINWEVLREFV